MVRPTINSNKHYVQISLATTLAGAAATNQFAVSVDAPLANTSNEVRQGSVIKAIFVEIWVRTNDTSAGTALLSVYKKTSADTVMSFAQQISLHTYPNKKNVFYHTQGLTNVNTSQATALFRGWIKIPKGKQRMGLSDALCMTISAQALDQNWCGFITYKEYF